MPRKRYNKHRDCRFDDWRRNDIPKGGITFNAPLYMTDIDCLEFLFEGDCAIPVALIEKKSDQSGWRVNFSGTMKASLELANRGMLSMIKQVCLPGQSILDPFCGTGTTGIAAIKHKCTFHGIDIDETNVNLSLARIAKSK